ncbi:MAG: transcription-repair coupling factor [Alistipes sp.]|nr:transcription-repair coupling factor [Alistipes sp.]
MHEILRLAETSPQVEQLGRVLEKKGSTVLLNEMVGGAFLFYMAALIAKQGGCHIVVCEDKDAAAYALNDLYALLGESNILFFPSAYKRSVVYGAEEAESVVMRTAALNAIKNFKEGYLVVVTYPEALAERVADEESLSAESLHLAVGSRIAVAELEERVVALGFEKVDFVYEPGQYSVRGGIFDVFSYSESKPYRLDFFDDEVESIRRFELSSQLSNDRLESIDIISNVNRTEGNRVSLAEFASGEVCYWFGDAAFVLDRVDDVRRKALQESEEPEEVAERLTSRRELLGQMEESCVVLTRNTLIERPASQTILFHTAPQNSFNKNFEVLADELVARHEVGYRTFLMSENRAQAERLEGLLYATGREGAKFELARLTLQNGFTDHDLKVSFYAEHRLFERYRRYKINGQIKRDEQMTIADLNSLQVGDYVTHIDHGVGRFGGLVKVNDGGKLREAIKLIYRDGDILFVNVHSLHRISRYKSGEDEAPKVHKLGSGAWQKLKNATKKAVKDISRELIALYAKRKASEGFAFSEDGYLQQALEASFEWEDTPDQLKASEAVKRDMESERPMDRLLCGDVGFGKTEVAIRAAFKAATDGKQVAVLVPTTILALQHYRSFKSRLRDFPVTIEYLNRTKSAKETSRILEELASGKIDILIGTHKMLGKGVEFNDLGLLIIDEEQRFGVAAKEKLTQLRVSVDTLTLTATPIPRTLQFSLMGSRDLSIISTPPPNRRPIETESHTFSEELVKEVVEAELARDGQVYFIHNCVEDLMGIKGMLMRLCPEARVAVAHGQMRPAELEKTIMDFIYHDYDILVATSIVESGVDIPNVNTIIINNADRFGLSNLHQLRGRVGRSDRKAYCYLLSRPDELLSSDARRRLRAIEEFSDLGSGFNIAMQDLDIRGAGNLLGAEQSGFIANIGFETYQKILNEAIAELRAEGLDVAGLSSEEQTVVEEARYVDDVTLELDVEAELPESYVRQQAERLKLYRKIDAMADEESLAKLELELEDRFGKMPQAAKELMNAVRLRHEAMRLGMERVKVKNGLMIVRFVGDDHSPYYRSEIFMELLRKITAQPDRFVLKQKDGKLAMTIRRVDDVATAVEVLKTL